MVEQQRIAYGRAVTIGPPKTTASRRTIALDRTTVRLLRAYGDGADLDVPDPYYGGDDGFEDVLDIVERSCMSLLEEIRAELP